MTLQYALERKVTEALGRSYYENAPATTKEKGRRNGYESVVDLRNQIALASEGDYAVEDVKKLVETVMSDSWSFPDSRP